MTLDRARTFLHLLRENQLLEAGQLDELSSTPDAEATEPHLLGQCLVEMGWLTPFQVQRLLQVPTAELKLGTFVLLDQLGDSGAGTTYKARRPGKPGVLALKVIPKKRLTTTEANTRFLQDVRLAAQLQHEYLAPVVTLAQAGDQYLLARACVDGTDLDHLVRESGPLPWFRACDVVRQVALALHHAHEQGLVHRRIKPGNLIAERGAGADFKVKLVDFGLAQLGSSAARLVEKPANPREDLLALGKTMHYLLMGGTTLKDTIDLDHELGTPPGVSAILSRLLADRAPGAFSSAAEAARALEPFCQEPPPKPTTLPDIPFTAAMAAVSVVPESAAEVSPPAELPVAEVALPMAVPIDVAVTPVEVPVPPPVMVASEPVPLEGIAVPVVDVGVVEPVPFVAPMADMPVAAGVPALEVPPLAGPPPEVDLPVASAIAVVSEPVPAEVLPPSIVTAISDPILDLPVASAMAVGGEPLAEPPIRAVVSEPVPELPLASASAVGGEPMTSEPVPEVSLASPIVPMTEPAAPEVPPVEALAPAPPLVAPPEPALPDLAPTAPVVPIAPAQPEFLPGAEMLAPPAPPPPFAGFPAVAPPPVSDFTEALAPPPPAPAEMFPAEAPTEAEVPFDTTRRPQKKPPKRLINWSTLGKKDIMWLLVGAVLWVVTMVLIYLVYLQMTREEKPSRPPGPPVRRPPATKMG